MLRVCRKWGKVVVLLALGAACRAPHHDEVDVASSALTVSPAITFTVTISTPHLVSPVTVAIGSANSLLIGAGTKITRPGVTPSVVTNVGAVGVDVEPAGLLGDLWSTSPVTLKDRVHLTGKAFVPAVIPGNNILIDGGIDSSTPRLPLTVTSWSVTYPAVVVSDITLQINQTGSQAPGRFGTVRLFSGAKLTLSAGSYYIDSLDLEPSAKLVLNQDAGPVLVYVRNTAILRGSIVTASVGNTPDLLFCYLGTADVFVEMPFTGTIVAPSAKLVLRTVTGGHTGAFFGNTVEVGPNTTVSYRPGQSILIARPPGTPDGCANQIQPSDSLTGEAREVQYQKDILRYCTGIGISSCERTIRARMNEDYFLASARLLSSRMSTGTHIQVLRDRDSKLIAFRKNPALACNVATNDADGDFVPNSADSCPNTPPLTPVLANGCTNTNVPPGVNIADVQKNIRRIGINVDPRCSSLPRPAVPIPLGAFRSGDPSLGKAIWVSKDPGTTGCPLYYDIEFYITDGSKIRTGIFLASSDVSLSWIPHPAGAVQFNIFASDNGDRGAWASYAVFTRTFRVRAFNFAGQRSAWSDFFSFGRQDCVAGGACQDQ